MNLTDKQKKIAERIRAKGQGHVLKWVDELDDAQKAHLFNQLDNLDFERMENLSQLIGQEGISLDFDKIEPADVERLPESPQDRAEEDRVIKSGAQALREGRVAALTVAGGQGTRLGYDGPKGTFPITPIQGKSLFEVLAEKVINARQKYDCPLPWLIMTSPTNHEDTIEFFENRDYFGMKPDSIYFFSQGINPILGESGELLLQDKASLLMGPNGHGGVFEALSNSRRVRELAENGIDLITYFQVDNPLVTVTDERFIGYHIEQNADFSCKMIKKREPGEGLGIGVSKEGKPGIVEYIDLPEDIAKQKKDNGELKFLFGSIAVHVIDLNFAFEMGACNDALPWHVAEKNYEHLDSDGEKKPSTCYKFERFVFDCLPYANDCAFVEVRREDEFAPVKNAEGEDSPASCRKLLTQQWLRWLDEAGVDISDFDGQAGEIEISPLYADDSGELADSLSSVSELEPPVVLG